MITIQYQALDLTCGRFKRALRSLAYVWGPVWLFAVCAMSVSAHPLGSPPGKMIDVQGTRMHLYCEGYGTPTVLLDAGLGGASLEWVPVMAQVAQFTEVCVYDRAGYGWSDLGSHPRTSSQEVDELYLLLANAGHRGPFILAGHSFGGYNAQLFARRYAFLTSGLVLVDASHPSQVERFQKYQLKTVPSSRFGLVLFGQMPPLHDSLSLRARLLMLYQFKHWKPRQTISDELLSFRDSAQELRNAQALPPIPLVVLTRGKRAWPLTPRGDQLEQLWIDLQTELAAQSPESAHLVVRTSGHMIHFEQPAMVAYGISLVFDAIRESGRWGHAPVARSQTVRQFDGAIANAVWLRDSLGVRAASRVAPAGVELHGPPEKLESIVH